jgi:hypothetical protein
VSKSLTVRYDRVTYLLNDTPEHRELIGRYIEVWEYPDERRRRSILMTITRQRGR